MPKITRVVCLPYNGRLFELLGRTCWVLAMLCLFPELVQAQVVTYAAPIVITRGGTYTGNYQSLASGVACIRVATTEPVVLDGCVLAGAGNLIEAASGVDLTVRNCRGQGLTPTVDNQAPGRFLDSYQAQRLVIEHNYFIQTSGIVVNRWSGTGQGPQTLTVRYNQARNIDGRWRNAGGSTRSSFLLLNTVQHLAGAEIAYNEVVNTANQSLVEDNINFYNSSGTAASALRVHDNFVRGAYPIPATAASFTGTGLTTDGDGATIDGATAYIEADHNQFVSTCNAAMNIAAGHDIYYHDNRLVTSALLTDGTRLNATYAATAVFNYYQQLAAIFFNNRIVNNTIGYVKWGVNSPYTDRQDLSPGACLTCSGNVSLPNPITVATEDNEYTLWQQKLAQNAVTVGITTSATASTAATGTITNPGFEADGAAVGAPTGWLTTTGAGTNDNADYTEAYPGAHTGTYHATHYRPLAYEVYTYQTVTGLAAGTYVLTAWVKSSGGQTTAQLQAKNYGGAALSAAISATTNGQWVQVSIPNVVVSNGQCELGVYSKASAGQWLYFDDVALVRQNTPPTVALTAAATLTLGQPLALNATAADTDGTVAKVEFFNGTTKLGESTTAPYQLSWTPTTAGTYSLTAVATDNGGASTTSAAVSVVVAAPAPVATTTTAANLITNPGFEADGAPVGSPTGWLTIAGSGTYDNADYTEAYPGAHTGTYHATHYRPFGYEIYTYQILNSVPNGTYTLTAWVKSSGGQTTAQLQAKNYGGATLTTDITAASSWVQVTVPNVVVTAGKCEIGVYSKALAGQWLYFDDLVFTTQAATVATGPNTVLNASFDDDLLPLVSPKKWSTQTWGTTQAYASYTEAYPGAHTGTYHATHYRPEAYEVYTYQTVTGLAAGTYALTAWVKSGGGQTTAQLQAKNYGGVALSAAISATTNGQWVQVSIPNVVVSNGQCELGVYSKASAGQWLYFDDVALVLQSGISQTSVVTLNAANAGLITATDLATATTTSTVSGGATLYPNPADSQVGVAVSFAQASAVQVSLTDLQGGVVAQYQRQAVAGDNQFTFDTLSLPSGIYILKIFSNQPTIVQRLQVKH